MTNNKEKDLKQLEAENKRLKRLLTRMHQGFWGIPAGDQSIGSKEPAEHFPLYISSILSTPLPFNERINKTLKVLGLYAEVSRIYIFENRDNGRQLSNSFEWCNDGVIPQRENLQDMSYNDFPTLKKMLATEGMIKASNIKSLPEEFHQILQQQHIESILIIPLNVNDHFFGFIGFDECSYNREWLAHELDLLNMASRLISSAYEREEANIEIRQTHDAILSINKELEKKEAFLQNLLSASPLGIMLIKNHKIEYINTTIINDLGYYKEELIGTPLANFFYNKDEDQQTIESFYEEIDREGIASIEILFKDKDGNPSTLRLLGKQMPGNSDDICYLLMGENISLIKETEKYLQESEDLNQKIIESTIDGIFIIANTNNTKKMIYANNAGLEMLGYEYDELANIKPEEVFPDKKHINRFFEVKKLISQGKDFIGEIQLLNKSKEIVHTEVYATSVQLKGQQHYYFSLHNITHRYRNEEELKLSERKFRALTENSPDHIIRINRKGTLSFCNAAFIKDFKLDLSYCLGKKLNELDGLPPEFTNELNNAIGDVLISKSITHIELEFSIDGQQFAFDWTITPETDNLNQLSSLLLVGRNFTLRKRAEQQLIIAKEKAESADNLKSAFLANMSHEIRTPLNAIVGFTNLLNENHITNEEKNDYIQIINSSSENLMSLINDIVDLAKIESGELSIHLQEANPNKSLADLYKLFEKRMDMDSKKHLKFYLNIPEDSSELLVTCDLKRLTQVFMNLVGNAFKFTSKGFIEIGYTKEANQLRFFVRDTGIGIAEDKQSIIFNPFRQEEEESSKHYGGTGLGLSISRRLIESMNSRLELSSEKHKGSEFYFSLPLKEKQSHQVTLKVPKPSPENVKLSMSINISWPDKIVLLVDATSTAQLQMRKNLEQTKITLISARTPNSARELLLKRNDIDLVLMDVNMPDLNAIEFIKSIRRMNIDIPFIAQFVETSPYKLKSLLNSGFDDAVTKPVQKNELLHKINTVLKGVHKSQLNLN